MFRSFLLSGVLATVHSFDGSANVLSLALPMERGGGDLAAEIWTQLQVQMENNPCPGVPHRAAPTDSCMPVPSAATPPDSPEPMSTSETQKGPENTCTNSALTVTPEPTLQSAQHVTVTSAASLSG